MTIEITNNNLDFSELHERMQWYVDEGIIPFANTLVIKGNDVVDFRCYGNIDKETDRPLTENAIFRMHSCTKLVCSIGAMMLWEEGKFTLDDPLEKYIPAFANMHILNPDAADIKDTHPAQNQIRIKHVMSHTAGFSYGFVEPDSTIDQAYNSANINPLAPGAGMTLESLCETLSSLPLVYEPGTFWRYSYATDVLARLIEVWSGMHFDEFLKTRIFNPLGMVDTDFYVPADKLDRLTTSYLPADPLDPMSPCVAPMDEPATTAHGHLPSFLSGGGGLLSTLPDFLSFSRMLINKGEHNGKQLIKPTTLALMHTNQCSDGVGVNFPMWDMPGTGFGLGFALKGQPATGEPDSAVGEYHWGGLAGTHFWWSPQANLMGICMTQKMPAFWHPFSHDFKRLAYKIAAS